MFEGTFRIDFFIDKAVVIVRFFILGWFIHAIRQCRNMAVSTIAESTDIGAGTITGAAVY